MKNGIVFSPKRNRKCLSSKIKDNCLHDHIAKVYDLKKSIENTQELVYVIIAVRYRMF